MRPESGWWPKAGDDKRADGALRAGAGSATQNIKHYKKRLRTKGIDKCP